MISGKEWTADSISFSSWGMELFRGEIAEAMDGKEEAMRGWISRNCPVSRIISPRGIVPWGKPSQSPHEGRPSRGQSTSAPSADTEAPTRSIPQPLGDRFGSPMR
jgi:hypothetical protein